MATDPAPGLFPGTLLPAFVAAPDVEDLALRVLRRWPEFKELRQAIDDGAIDVAFVFETKPFDPEKEEFKPHTIAKVTKASPLWACMSGHDLVIQFRQAFWDVFDEARREAVLHHEWMHVAWDGKLSLRPHDVEEMVQSARRYGPSLPGRRELAAAFADWARENAGDNVVPMRPVPAAGDDLPDLEEVAHAFGNAVADAIARGEFDDGETTSTITRDVSRFDGLVLPEESLDQAYARLERRGDFTEVMASDAGQLLLRELAQQREIRRRTVRRGGRDVDPETGEIQDGAE